MSTTRNESTHFSMLHERGEWCARARKEKRLESVVAIRFTFTSFARFVPTEKTRENCKCKAVLLMQPLAGIFWLMTRTICWKQNVFQLNMMGNVFAYGILHCICIYAVIYSRTNWARWWAASEMSAMCTRTLDECKKPRRTGTAATPSLSANNNDVEINGDWFK